MPAPVDLAQLYEAVFGEPPSHTSRIVLHRLERLLGLKPGDAFSRMLIVQLRSADQIETTRGQFSATVEELGPLIATARRLTLELERSSGDVARRNRRIPAMEHAAELVDTSLALPLFAYLASAFQRRRPYDDQHVSDRRAAARFDLFLLAMASLVVFAAGAALLRFVMKAH